MESVYVNVCRSTQAWAAALHVESKEQNLMKSKGLLLSFCGWAPSLSLTPRELSTSGMEVVLV